MPEQPKNDSSYLKRYLALQALRDNILYTEPVKDTLAGSIEDIPGKARSLAGPLAESLASRAVISNDPDIRREQINQAIAKVREAKGNPEARNEQMLTNALRLGAVAAPVGAVAGGLIGLMGRGRPPFSGGKLVNPLPSFGSNLKLLFAKGGAGKLNAADKYRRLIANEAKGGALESGSLGAIAGASGGLFAGTAKPSDEDIQAAANILQEHPYASALPGGEAAAVADSYFDKHNPALSGLIGAGFGGALAVPATALPSTLQAGGTLAGNMLKGLNAMRKGTTPEYKSMNYLNNLGGAFKKNLLLNALSLGLVGGIGGYVSGQHRPPQDTA